MPVDLSIGNSIIGAYLQGRKLRERTENRKADEEFRQKKLEADTKQFEQQLKSQQDFHNAQLELQRSAHDVAKFQARNAFLEAIGQGRVKGGTFSGQGEIPEGAVVNQSPEQSIEQLLNMQTGQRFTPPEVKLPVNAGPLGTISPNEFQTPTEYGQATFEAQRPKIEATQKAKISEMTLRNTLDLIKGTQLESQRQSGRKEIQGLKDAAAWERAVENAKSRAKSRAQNTASLKNRFLTESEVRTIPGAKVGDTLLQHAGATIGTNLTQTQQGDLNNTQELIDFTDEIERLGKEANWEGIGPITGKVGSIGASLGLGNPKEEELRQAIGQFQGKISLAQGGKSFTATEQTLVRRYAPDLAAGGLKTKIALTRLKDVFEKSIDRTVSPTTTIKVPKPSNTPAKTVTVDGHNYMWDGAKYVLSGKVSK